MFYGNVASPVACRKCFLHTVSFFGALAVSSFRCLFPSSQRTNDLAKGVPPSQLRPETGDISVLICSPLLEERKGTETAAPPPLERWQTSHPPAFFLLPSEKTLSPLSSSTSSLAQSEWIPILRRDCYPFRPFSLASASPFQLLFSVAFLAPEEKETKKKKKKKEKETHFARPRKGRQKRRPLSPRAKAPEDRCHCGWQNLVEVQLETYFSTVATHSKREGERERERKVLLHCQRHVPALAAELCERLNLPLNRSLP